MFRALNYLQYFLMRPFRFAMKKRSSFMRRMYRFGLFRFVYNIVIYFVAAPLRLVNAIWYDLVVYGLFSFRDSISDVFAPRTKKWTKKGKFVYFLGWLFGLPFRLIKMVFSSGGRLLEGLFFTIYDLFVPTLTMMHGTSEESSIKISGPGQWLVGNGNFAGSGLYFTMERRVAEHYADASAQGKKKPNKVIIYARVSLGKNINLMMVPDAVYPYVLNHDGDALTRWGQDHNYDSFEWWRSSNNTNWWEYCIIKSRGSKVRTWRVRVLYIYDDTDREVQRIWGGKAFWMGSLGQK